MTEPYQPGQDAVNTVSETLEIFSDMHRFNSWLFDSLALYCTDHLLEIGSGIGNISEKLLEQFSDISLSDMSPVYCEVLQRKFAGHAHLGGIHQIDLAAEEFSKRYVHLQNGFDSIIASNVMEHIQDDHQALQHCKFMLRDQGRLVVLVPAGPGLYSSFDRELGHFRRYTRTGMEGLFQEEGFRILHLQYFNFVGIFGWWFSGIFLKKKVLPREQVLLYDKLVPIIKLIDGLVRHHAGLSLIIVGEKK